MIFIHILALIAIGSLIQFIQSKMDDSQIDSIEKRHQKMADMLQGNPLIVREMKARLETSIHYDVKQIQNIDYKPKHIKEVTTPEEREARHKAEVEGRPYVHKWTEDQINDVIEDSLSYMDMSRDELAVLLAYGSERLAQQYSEECGVSIDDARFLIDQVGEVLCGGKMPTERERKKSKRDIIPGEELYKLNGIPMRTVRSSSVYAAGYNERKRILYIEFTSGSTYEYLDVPRIEYVELINSKSPGRFVNNVLTPGYEYRSIKNDNA